MWSGSLLPPVPARSWFLREELLLRLSKSPSVGEGARVDFWDDEEEDFELLLAPRSWSVGSYMYGERVGQWLLMEMY